MKILILPDSFKGSLSASDVCEEMVKAVKHFFPASEVISIPFSDGGEGALEVLKNNIAGKLEYCNTYDAVHRNIIAPYFKFKKNNTAWIELSQTAGLAQLSVKDQNPLKTSTYGTGVMLKDALEKGCTTLYLGIGGSATHDLGFGLLQALGVGFFDENGKEIKINGGSLHQIHDIVMDTLDPRAKKAKWIIACDVQNTLLGENGAAYTYAKQKGANLSQIKQLEFGTQHIAQILLTQFQKNIKNLIGGGASGGVSAGLHALLNAKLTSGFELLSKTINLDNHINTADLILTGEGQFDFQSQFGKLPNQVAKKALSKKIPTLLFTGKSEIYSVAELPHLQVFTITPKGVSMEKAMNEARLFLSLKLAEILPNFKFLSK